MSGGRFLSVYLSWRNLRFCAIFVGVAYQLGNAISSPSTQLINQLSEISFTKGPYGSRVEACGAATAISKAVIALGVAATTAFGPENKETRFEEPAAATGDQPATEPAARIKESSTAKTNADSKSHSLGLEKGTPASTLAK